MVPPCTSRASGCRVVGQMRDARLSKGDGIIERRPCAREVVRRPGFLDRGNPVFAGPPASGGGGAGHPVLLSGSVRRMQRCARHGRPRTRRRETWNGRTDLAVASPAQGDGGPGGRRRRADWGGAGQRRASTCGWATWPIACPPASCQVPGGAWRTGWPRSPRTRSTSRSHRCWSATACTSCRCWSCWRCRPAPGRGP